MNDVIASPAADEIVPASQVDYGRLVYVTAGLEPLFLNRNYVPGHTWDDEAIGGIVDETLPANRASALIVQSCYSADTIVTARGLDELRQRLQDKVRQIVVLSGFNITNGSHDQTVIPIGRKGATIYIVSWSFVSAVSMLDDAPSDYSSLLAYAWNMALNLVAGFESEPSDVHDPMDGFRTGVRFTGFDEVLCVRFRNVDDETPTTITQAYYLSGDVKE